MTRVQPDLARALEIAAEAVCEVIEDLVSAYTRPSVLYRPTLSKDGDKWIALYGEDLQSGVVGTGPTPAVAMQDFDEAWCAEPKA